MKYATYKGANQIREDGSSTNMKFEWTVGGTQADLTVGDRVLFAVVSGIVVVFILQYNPLPV